MLLYNISVFQKCKALRFFVIEENVKKFMVSIGVSVLKGLTLKLRSLKKSPACYVKNDTGG